jgi:hypothetical protein
MKREIEAALMICLVVVMPALASTEADIFTKSYLFTSGSELTALRTISYNHLSTPDLEFKSNTEITNEVISDVGGNAEIDQIMQFHALKQQFYGVEAALSSSVSGRGIKEIGGSYSVDGLADVSNTIEDPEAHTKVEFNTVGLAMASANAADRYVLYVNGGYKTTTTGVFIATPIVEKPKISSVSLELSPMQFEVPADSIQQDLSFDFEASNGDLDNYGFDFSRTIEVGDVSCSSKMEYKLVNT